MKSLHRAIDLLLAFQSERELAVEELANILGWPASSVYRFVRVLRDHGLLSFVPERKKYTLGSVLCRLGRAGGLNLSLLAGPALEQLTKETGETSFLSVRERRGDRVHCDDRDSVSSASGEAAAIHLATERDRGSDFREVEECQCG